MLEALLELNNRIYTEFRFRSGVTTISTPVSQVMERREGVCQDFSHVDDQRAARHRIAGPLYLGLHPHQAAAGPIKRQGADQSHAWVGCWLGPEHGWVDVDPTNGIVVKDEHVLLGWGRDFSDVSPVRGVILGGGNHVVRVSVDLEPMEEAEAE